MRGKTLDRHWRNVRTLASHNPPSYKAQGLGAYELHGTRLATLGFLAGLSDALAILCGALSGAGGDTGELD
jgi:hypothetical protein